MCVCVCVCVQIYLKFKYHNGTLDYEKGRSNLLNTYCNTYKLNGPNNEILYKHTVLSIRCVADNCYVYHKNVRNKRDNSYLDFTKDI